MKLRSPIAAIACAVMTTLVGATASADWTGTQDVSNRGPDHYSMDVAVAPDGSAQVAWVREVRIASFSTRGAVQVRRYAADGTPGQIRTLSGPVDSGSPEESSPQVAIDDQGRSVVIWERDGAIRLLRIEADGTPSAEGIQTISQGGQVSDPDVAMTPAGAVVATWQRFDDAANDVRTIVARRIPAGTSAPDGAEIPVAVFTDGDSDGGDFFQFSEGPRIATAPNGDSVLTWLLFECQCSSGVNATFAFQARRLSAAGAPGTLHDLSGAGTANNQIDVDVGIDDSANATVQYVNPAGSPMRAFVRRVGADDTLGPERALSDPALAVGDMELDVAPGGAATVIWSDSDPGNCCDETGRFARLSPDGAVAEAGTQFAPGPDIDYVTVAVDDAGESSLFWDDYDGSAYNGHGRRLSAAGVLGAVQDFPASRTASWDEMAADAGGADALGAWVIEDDETPTVDDAFVQGAFFRGDAQGDGGGGGAGGGGGGQAGDGTTSRPGAATKPKRCKALRKKMKRADKQYRKRALRKKLREKGC